MPDISVCFFTLGCKVNRYESEALRELFMADGFECLMTKGEESPKVIVINTCTVTSLADRKSRQLLRRLRRENPKAVIVLTGCMPQTSPELAQSLTEADIVTGTKDKGELLRLVREFLRNGERRISIPPLFEYDPFEPLTVSRFDDSFQRAYLKIEDGCDCRCAYCAIPNARGYVRSRQLRSITVEAQKLVDSGYKELVLTGINLSRYGGGEGLTLADAVEAACAAGGEYRVRLGSVEPVLITKEDYLRLREQEKLCPQFHLALQSGCDETLKRMGRRYNTAQYKETVSIIQQLFNNPSITTDIIVGFPGETQEEFDATCSFVASLPLLSANIFEYSERADTPAAHMPNQASPQEKRRRSVLLTQLCNERAQAFAMTQVGKTAKVLTEANGGGYTENYLRVTFLKPIEAGCLVDVKLTGPASKNGVGCTAEVI